MHHLVFFNSLIPQINFIRSRSECTMATISVMVRFFTQMYPMTTMYPPLSRTHRCLAIKKGKLVPMDQPYKTVNQYQLFSDKTGAKGPGKEEQIEKIKIPGFTHPDTKNEEGYFTQKAHQQLEELKKKLEKPTVDNTEKKE